MPTVVARRQAILIDLTTPLTSTVPKIHGTAAWAGV